ncbi:MAG: SRPBCC domain-containing protein [Candidatus Sulfotelmatobacter sp.]
MTPIKSKDDSLRSIVHEIEIAASAADVWKALTDPAELVRWFPLDAKVKPGEGGSIWLSWGGTHIEEAIIEAWEPNKHLRTKEIAPFGAYIQPGDAKNLSPRNLDFLLTPANGNTTLHFEYSGFGTGPGWDYLYEPIDAAFDFQLNCLKFYLERCPGQDRSVSWARTVFHISPKEAWGRLAGPQGFLREGSFDGLQKGNRYSIQAANGDKFDGEVLTYHPGRQFGATVENLNSALLRLSVGVCTGVAGASVWLASFGEKHPDANLFEHRWTNLLETVLR